MKHSNVFYIRTADGFSPVKNAIPLPNKAGLDLFRIDFNISDGKTGYRILANGSNKAMTEALKRIEDDEEYRKGIESSIANAIKQDGGLSPRYTRPDEDYAVVFSPAKVAAAAGGKRRAPEKRRSKKAEKDKAMYETALSNAEQAIRSKASVQDTMVNGVSLILSLFKENNVDITPRTRGWVKSSLYGVHYDAEHHIWAFQHRGNFYPSFRVCFEQLV